MTRRTTKPKPKLTLPSQRAAYARKLAGLEKGRRVLAARRARAHRKED
jgi:hypothetical protein